MIRRPLKQRSKVSVHCQFQDFCSENFLQIIIQPSVPNFIFSKVPCFQHILLNTCRWILLKYEKYSLRLIFFQTLKQHSDCKSFISKTFDRNIFKIKAASPVQIIKNKKQCFQLCLVRTYSLVLSSRFLCSRSGAQVKLRVQKIGCLERNMSISVT